MHEFSRRTALGAAWSAPVIVLAATAPGAAASVDLGITLSWQPSFSVTATGRASLVVTTSDGAIPAEDGTFVLTLAALAGSPGAVTLTPALSGAYWADSGVPGPSITFLGPAGLPMWSTPTQVEFGFALADEAAPVDLRAILMRNGQLVAVSPTMAIGRPWVGFERPSYRVVAGGVIEVRGAFTGPSGTYPTSEQDIQVANGNTADFRVEPYIADASGFILAAYSLGGAGASTTVSVVQPGYTSETVTIVSV